MPRVSKLEDSNGSLCLVEKVPGSFEYAFLIELYGISSGLGVPCTKDATSPIQDYKEVYTMKNSTPTLLEKDLSRAQSTYLEVRN